MGVVLLFQNVGQYECYFENLSSNYWKNNVLWVQINCAKWNRVLYCIRIRKTDIEFNFLIDFNLGIWKNQRFFFHSTQDSFYVPKITLRHGKSVQFGSQWSLSWSEFLTWQCVYLLLYHQALSEKKIHWKFGEGFIRNSRIVHNFYRNKWPDHIFYFMLMIPGFEKLLEFDVREFRTRIRSHHHNVNSCCQSDLSYAFFAVWKTFYYG